MTTIPLWLLVALCVAASPVIASIAAMACYVAFFGVLIPVFWVFEKLGRGR